jgi:hypothetical protein
MARISPKTGCYLRKQALPIGLRFHRHASCNITKPGYFEGFRGVVKGAGRFSLRVVELPHQTRT